jgi:fatty-acid desaturase
MAQKVLKRAGFSLKTLFKVIYAILKQETFFLNSFTKNFGKINFYQKNNHAKINCFRWESNLSLLHRKREQNQ